MLKTDLSTKYSKVGDSIELDMRRAQIVNFGRNPGELSGEHTLLVGKVTMVRRAGKGQTGAVAVQIVEARSKDGSERLNVTLANPVLTMHDVAGRHGPGTVMPNGVDISPIDEITINQDPLLGDVLSSKHNFFLVKNQTQLTVMLR